MKHLLIPTVLLLCACQPKGGMIKAEFSSTPAPVASTQPSEDQATIPENRMVTHKSIEVRQPTGAIDAATIAWAQGSASTGAGQPSDNALGQLQPLTYAGIGLCVIGVGMVVARAWVPVIPITAAVAAILLGGGFIVAPVLIDRYAAWIAFGGAVVGFGVLAYLGWKLNWFKLQTGADTQLKLLTKGQDEAAGALRFLATGGNKTEAKSILAIDKKDGVPNE